MLVCPNCRHAFDPPGKRPLTLKEKALLDYITGYIDRTGVGPTYVEMGAAMGTGITTVHEHLRNLDRKGYVVRYKHRARGIRVA